jgi:DNA helicase-2/ATP-dependent DNA helicase PcrA
MNKLSVKESYDLFETDPRLFKGNLQVIACAGAGKTEFVSKRIAYLISKNKAKPENIVAFTFTERAAEELKFRIRQRIRELIGHQPDVGDMYVGTIHSFCFKLLQEFVPKYRVYDVLDEGKRYAFVSSISKELNYQVLLPSLKKRFKPPYGTTPQSWVLNTFLRGVDIVREEMLNPESVSESTSFIGAFKVYEETLEKKRFLDFSTMMSIAVKELKTNKELLKEVRAKYTHITVDEYQDINPIQEELIRLIAGDNGNLCVVGDDDQSIYQWRGSNTENIIKFTKRYKDAYTYPLPKNYRSTKLIIDCANQVIKNNDPKRLPKIMESAGASGDKGDVYKLTFEHQFDEIRFVVDKIRGLIGTEITDFNGRKRGLSYSDISVFFRSVKYDAEPYLNALREAGVPVAVSGIGGLFESEEADIIFEIFAYLGNFKKIWDYGRREGQVPDLNSIYERVKEAFIPPPKPQFIRIFETLKEDIKAKGRITLQGLYADILSILGLQNETLHADENEIMLYNIGRISQAITDYEATRTYCTYKDIERFCWFIKHYAEGTYDAGAGDDPTLALNAVQVMTLHGTKGLGFPVVFMPYSIYKKPRETDPGYLNPEAFDFKRYHGSEEDARRLFYVGMTRAKKFLFISYPKLCRQRAYKKPSKFFLEVPDKPCIIEPIPDPAKRIKLKPEPSAENIQFPTSYSELSDYIRCGYDYKLRYIYNFNPELVQALGYGKHVHNIINMLHKKAQKTGKIPSLEEVEDITDKHFYLRYAAKEQMETLKKSAVKSIQNYVKLWKEDFSLTVKTERAFEYDVENALISGSIDLLKRENVSEDILEIVDFKTGKQRKAQVEEDAILQAQLYTIAAREALDLNIKKAYIHYLDAASKPERVEALTTPKQLEYAKKTIIQAVNGITSRRFRRDAKGIKTCNQCDFKILCPKVKR